MKKLLFLIAFITANLLSFTSNATHFASFEITYNYLGPDPSTPGNERYEVFLAIIYDRCSTCAGPSTSATLCVTSSCTSSQTFTMGQVNHPSFVTIRANGDTLAVAPGDTVPESYDCARPNLTSSPGQAEYFEIYTYSTTVSLSKCRDWNFAWRSCCRNGAITNGFANEGNYIDATLNNLIGPNSSPQFLKPGAKRFCVIPNPSDPNVIPFNWDHPAQEVDGDSLHYSFTTPQEANFGCPLTPTNLNFSAPYTVNAPLTTFNGFTIDPKLGFFTFIPTQQEVCVVKISVEEWRFNTTTLAYELVGEVYRDMQVPVDATCRTAVLDGPKPIVSGFGFDLRNFSRDSIFSLLDSAFGGTQDFTVNNDSVPGVTPAVYNIPVIPYSCGDSEITVRFNVKEPVFCPTVDPTDFRLMGPDGVARPIFEVETGCTPVIRESSIMKLKLFQSLDINGIYVLQIKRGNDGNTLQNKCGYEIVDNFFMIIKVDDCPDLKYEMTNVTVDNDQRTKVEYSLDTNTFVTNAFERIDVLRANQGDPVQYLASITDINARAFFDSTTNAEAVDQQAYVYILQMITNGRARVSTNFVNSILLEGDVNDEQTRVDLTWNDYENTTYGAPAEFEVFVSDVDAAGPTWESVQIVGRDMQYTYNIPENEMKWLKVEAQDPADSNLLISESNWIVVGSTTPPPPPTLTPAVTYVPNVITPNNDGISDRLYFSIFPQDPSLRPYSDMSLSIFNRWGKQVFEDNNYMQRNTRTDGWDGTDQNTGAELAEGVYFYVAKFSDDATGMKEELNGSITLGNSGTN